MIPHQRAAMAVALFGLIGQGCDTGVGDGGEEISPECMEATMHSDLEWIQEFVFDASCVFSACHRGAALSAGELNLEAGLAQAALVTAI
jgi:hypothetical protein